MNNRRPIKSRGHPLAKKIAAWLSRQNVTPNQISVMSVVFGFSSGLCFHTMSGIHHGFLEVVLPLLAAFFIQLRLLCNLFDGMVAVEGGKSTKSGELFNDVPDRVADSFIFIGAGFLLGPHFYWGVLAALMAVLTAYVRTLSTSLGAPTRFAGPMAKQHRMALMTLSCLLMMVPLPFADRHDIVLVTLIAITLGSLVTCFRRLKMAYQYLEGVND